jgi:hypothetical protein
MRRESLHPPNAQKNTGRVSKEENASLSMEDNT